MTSSTFFFVAAANYVCIVGGADRVTYNVDHLPPTTENYYVQHGHDRFARFMVDFMPSFDTLKVSYSA